MAVRGAGFPVIVWKFPVNAPLPTAFKVLAGTEVTLDTTAVGAAPAWPFDMDGPDGGVVLAFNLIRTKVSTIAATTMMLPAATKMRACCVAWRAGRSRLLLGPSCEDAGTEEVGAEPLRMAVAVGVVSSADSRL